MLYSKPFRNISVDVCLITSIDGLWLQFTWFKAATHTSELVKAN